MTAVEVPLSTGVLATIKEDNSIALVLQVRAILDSTVTDAKD